LKIDTNLVSPVRRGIAFAVVAAFVLALIATGGCKSSSTPSVLPTSSPTPIPSGSPTPTPSPTPTANVFVGLDYPSVPPTLDPTYGDVQGYAPLANNPVASPSPSPVPTISSAIVNVHCNQNIQFINLDHSSPHTASSLGPANGMNWPGVFNNPNGVSASPQLTAISTGSFSSGVLAAGGAGTSPVYSTGGVAGSFYFGDYYDFSGSPQMRTVITVLCP